MNMILLPPMNQKILGRMEPAASGDTQLTGNAPMEGIAGSSGPLVNIAPPEFDVMLNIIYASDRNFTGQPVYANAACYLHPAAAEALHCAIDLAARQNLRLCIYDGYRPIEAQWALWRHTPDPTFLADPRRGSPHSRGIAVDLTLIDAGNGLPIDMGGPVDDLTPRGFHGYRGISTKAQKNRMMLLGLMASAGFDHYLNEWWHYQLYSPRNYPLLWETAARTGLMGD